MAVKKKRGETKEMEAEKILVVDDNKEIVYSISELLKYEGYEILKAYDGMEALDIMERENVDLILLDVMMPRLNGLSALMKLREKSRIPAPFSPISPIMVPGLTFRLICFRTLFLPNDLLMPLIDKMYLFLSTVITLLPFLDERRVSSLTPLCVSFIYHLTSLLF